jgi:tRNA dimethylallyltransferase
LSILKMPYPEEAIPLVVVVGATAVGKTEISLRVAEIMGGEIVSADSRLFYRGMDIGTAKPTVEERGRVPHHLIDVADPDQPWSLTMFQEAAAEKIRDIHRRGKTAFLVGGTGQYIRAVIEGWLPPAQEPNPRLREVLEAWGRQIGPLELHRRLAIIDPAAAAANEAPNLRRTVRALEVIFSSGKLFSRQRRKSETPYRLWMVGLRRPRPELYDRIDLRIDQMMKMGFLDEVRGLLAKGYSPRLPTLSAIGYREMTAVLSGEMTQAEAVTQIKRLTRRYVRQQSNWFSETDEGIHWFEAGDEPSAQIVAWLRTEGLA